MSGRRAFLKEMLKASGAAAGAVALSPSLLTAVNGLAGLPHGGGVMTLAGADPKGLAARAVEAARRAGAAYADVRLTYDWSREIGGGLQDRAIHDAERLSVGVRALVNGYWGFASSAVWTADEMARLGTEAVALAKSNALGGRPRPVDLGTIPIVRDGVWTAPIKQDPTTIPVSEVTDFIDGLGYWSGLELGMVVRDVVFEKQEKVFASTEGSSFTQSTYSTNLVLGLAFGSPSGSMWMPYEFTAPPGHDWESLRANQHRIRELLPALREELKQLERLPHVPIEVGRYDVVLDAASMGSLLASSLGCAIQLDRALGYEANASGTSYLNDPLGMLGTYQVGAPLLEVTANRSVPGAAASVRWDDEGVVPEEMTLVKEGVLVDFPTTRESATWLAPYYAKRGRPVRSHGCARGAEGLYSPLAHPPNLTLAPGKQEASFEDLIADLSTGLAVTQAIASVDYQCLNGTLVPAGSSSQGGHVYKVKNGRRIAYMGNLHPQYRKVDVQGNFLFRSPELWKGLEVLGGPASARWFRGRSRKGQPEQEVAFDVQAVPARVKQLAFIDPSRKV